jgi:hypothetical protein
MIMSIRLLMSTIPHAITGNSWLLAFYDVHHVSKKGKPLIGLPFLKLLLQFNFGWYQLINDGGNYPRQQS